MEFWVTVSRSLSFLPTDVHESGLGVTGRSSHLGCWPDRCSVLVHGFGCAFHSQRSTTVFPVTTHIKLWCSHLRATSSNWT